MPTPIPSSDPTQASPSASAPPAGGRPPAALRGVIKAAIALLVLGLAWRFAAGLDWSALAERLGDVDAALATLAGALLVVRYLVWSHRYGLALAALGERVRFRRRLAAITASIAVNHVTPYLRVFGAIFRARYLARQSERSFAQHYAAVLFEQLVHNVVLGALLWVVGVALAWGAGRRGLAVASLIAGSALIVYLLRRRSGSDRPTSPLVELVARKARHHAARFRPLRRHGKGLVEVIRTLLANRPLWSWMALWTLVFGALNIVSQWLVFLALGTDVGALTVIAVVGGGVVVGAVTGSPGGLATTEAAMTAGFIALGVESTDAAAATLIYRGLHYAVVLATGVPPLLYFETIEKRRPLTDRDPSDPAATPEPGGPDGGSAAGPAE